MPRILSVCWPAGAREGSATVGRGNSSHAPSRTSRPSLDVAPHAQDVLGPARRLRPTPPRSRAVGGRVAGRLGGGVVGGEGSDRRRRRCRSRSGSPRATACAGAIATRCLTWMVDSTARSPGTALPLGHHADAATVLEDQAHDPPVTQDLAPTRLDDLDERSGQLARAAAWDRPAAALTPEDDRVGERRRARRSRPAGRSGRPSRA